MKHYLIEVLICPHDSDIEYVENAVVGVDDMDYDVRGLIRDLVLDNHYAWQRQYPTFEYEGLKVEVSNGDHITINVLEEIPPNMLGFLIRNLMVLQ